MKITAKTKSGLDVEIKIDDNDRVISWGGPETATLLTKTNLKEFKKYCKTLIEQDSKSERNQYKEFNFVLGDYCIRKNGLGEWSLSYDFNGVTIPDNRRQRHKFIINGALAIEKDGNYILNSLDFI